TITALSLDAGLSLGPLIGQGALLQMQQADGSLRPLHGRITAAERLGSNGGLARYRLRLQPWLAFLSQRVDSYVFHDRTVVEIVEDIFA
ncbi:contractile injection system protein, VgrG/Pvc8 family, partial [Stenotrophomonas sp. PSU-St83]